MIRRIPYLIGGSAVGFVSGVVFGWAVWNVPVVRPDPQLAVRAIEVTLQEGALPDFVTLIRQFADEHAFAIRVVVGRFARDDLLIQLFREDIKSIILRRDAMGGNSPILAAFYANTAEDRNPDWAYDELVSGLRAQLQGAPGVISIEDISTSRDDPLRGVGGLVDGIF